MNDLLFLVPLIMGLIVMALGFKLQIPKGIAMNRPAFGIALIVGSLFWWLASAILLAYEGKSYSVLNVLTVLAFLWVWRSSFRSRPPQPAPTSTACLAPFLSGLGLSWVSHTL